MSLRPLLTSFPSLYPSSSSYFHTTTVHLASRARITAKRKRLANLERRAQLSAADNIQPDPVLGHFPSSTYTSRFGGPSPSSSSPSSSASSSHSTSEPYETSRLARTVLIPEAIWSTPPSQDRPQRFLPGLSPEDKSLLFGAVPHVSSALGYGQRSSGEQGDDVVRAQEQGSATMMKILDLRNASRKGIEVVNRQRIVDEFGGGQSGGSEVQAALLTHQIRNLHTHLLSNPRDVHNKRQLRLLVHARARVLKYLKRRDQERYEKLLGDLGLEKRAVEGEIIVR